ncbi:F-box protein At5g39250-like [Chenopodium quinoa]|nr:F-box protein At5g39250-like [Chenopodium quinoa]
MTCVVLKAVFPLLDGVDLASCMLVCKQWRDIAQDDYLWKCLCARRWPSLCKRPSPSTVTYYKLYGTFYKRRRHQALPPSRLSFNDLDFYIDIWAEGQSIFSEVFSGLVLHGGIKTLPTGISNILRYRLEGPDYKMMLPVEPRFSVPLGQKVSVSVLVGRRDSSKFACIVNKAMFDDINWTSFRALAFDYLDFSPIHPFISGIRAWVSLLFADAENDEVANVFGIEMDFCDAANNETEVLWLLDMLDWK